MTMASELLYVGQPLQEFAPPVPLQRPSPGQEPDPGPTITLRASSLSKLDMEGDTAIRALGACFDSEFEFAVDAVDGDAVLLFVLAREREKRESVVCYHWRDSGHDRVKKPRCRTGHNTRGRNNPFRVITWTLGRLLLRTRMQPAKDVRLRCGVVSKV